MKLSGRAVKDVPRLDLGATAEAPGDRDPFASTICGEVHVLSTSADASPAQVAQVHAGVELVGWVGSAKDVRRGLERCAARRVVKKVGQLTLWGGATAEDAAPITQLPPGFLGSELGDVDDLASCVASSGSVYWLVPEPRGGTVCRQWRFVRLPDGATALVRVTPITYEGQRAFASFGASYQRPALMVLGPSYTREPLDAAPRSKTLGGYRCGLAYTFAGTRDGALRMSVVGAPAGSELVAWHEDDEERWYLTEAACEAARVRANEALERSPDATPPGGVHVDCFENQPR